MLYRDREKHGKVTPMTTKEIAIKSVQVVCQRYPRGGFPIGFANASRGGYLALLSALNVPGRVLLSSATLFGTQLFALCRMQTQKSTVYREHPMKSFTILQVLSVAVPALMVVTTLSGLALEFPPEAMELLQSAQDLLAVNAMGCAVREFFQTWSRSCATAGVDLMHADGSGLTAREQRWVNLLSDAMYVGTSLLLLLGGPALAKEWLVKVAASVKDTSSAFVAAALLNIFAGLNDMCEAWCKETSKIVCGLFWGGRLRAAARHATQPRHRYDPLPQPHGLQAHHTACH